MTSQGTKYGQSRNAFRRALAAGNLTVALATAAELGGRIDLADALTLTLLLRDQPGRYERAAARWLARYTLETSGVNISEVQLLAAALAALRADHVASARVLLAGVFSDHGRRDLLRVVRRDA